MKFLKIIDLSLINKTVKYTNFEINYVNSNSEHNVSKGRENNDSGFYYYYY